MGKIDGSKCDAVTNENENKKIIGGGVDKKVLSILIHY